MCLVLLGAGLTACGPGHRTVVRVVDGVPLETRFVSPSAYLHYTRARIALDRGRLDQATTELNKALIFDPDSAYLQTQLASVLGRRGRPDEALALLDGVLESHPDDPEALQLRARLKRSAGAATK
jgi:predicted Zn-dependent protease